jgi:hypothetical protein
MINNNCFRINQVKWLGGNVQYLLIFSKEQMLFIKIGGQFADAEELTYIVTRGLLGYLLRKKVGKIMENKRVEKKNTLNKKSISELLSSDKKNFEIFYHDILNINLKKSRNGINGPRTGILKVKTSSKEYKFEIAPNQDYKSCENIVKKYLLNKLI